MRKSLVVALVAALAAFTMPTIASAATTYNITVPVKVTGLVPSGTYQVACALGITNPANIPAPTSFSGPINGGSYSGNQTVTLTASTPQHSYACALFQIIAP
jgi:hypothetical protein